LKDESERRGCGAFARKARCVVRDVETYKGDGNDVEKDAPEDVFDYTREALGRALRLARGDSYGFCAAVYGRESVK
jgi:hypothetical protein